MNKETFLPVSRAPGYLIGSNGTVISCAKTVRFYKSWKTIKERVRKHNFSVYPFVGLMVNGKIKTFSIHRLIAEEFIPNPNNKPQVNHKNGIKTDFSIENLEWVTASENCIHTRSNLGKGRGESTWKSKLKEAQIREIFLLRQCGITFAGIGRIYGVEKAAIWKVINGLSWTYIGIKKPVSIDTGSASESLSSS